jgi:hypothetical protein
VGIELVQVCTKELCVDFGRNKFVEYSVTKISARSASSRRTPGGREVFIVQEIHQILSYSKSRDCKVCVGSQNLRGDQAHKG